MVDNAGRWGRSAQRFRQNSNHFSNCGWHSRFFSVDPVGWRLNGFYDNLFRTPSRCLSYINSQSPGCVTLGQTPKKFLTGDLVLNYCGLAKVSRSTSLSNANELEFELELDEQTAQRARKAHLDDRLLPRKFLITRIIRAERRNCGRLAGFQGNPTGCKGQRQGIILPRRRVVATKWMRFPGLKCEIPTSFDSWTDESGTKSWYRNRTNLSVETSIHPNSGIFYMSGYGLPELAKG